jgi:sensor histidine kinase YesM
MPHQKRNSILFHAVASGIILLMPILDAPSPNATALMMLKNPFVGIDFLLHFLCVSFGYANYFYFVPQLFYRRSRFLYFFLASGCFLFLALVPSILSLFPSVAFFTNSTEVQVHSIIQIRHIFFLFMLVLLYGLLSIAEERRRTAERELSVANLSYLKAQINPHFLFNTLNTIYVQIQLNPQQAGNALVKMSNIMRYILKASENNAEQVSQAIGYLQDYLDLQKQRFLNTILIDFDCEVDRPDKYYIAPLLLIPFVENAFKYGIHPHKVSEISVQIRLQANHLFLQVKNVDYSLQNQSAESYGIGIGNTRKRLSLIYPNRHQLTIKKVDEFFLVQLKIDLTK